MAFVVPVLHMTQKSPVSDWIGWIYRRIDKAIQEYLLFVLYIFTFYMLRIYCWLGGKKLSKHIVGFQVDEFTL